MPCLHLTISGARSIALQEEGELSEDNIVGRRVGHLTVTGYSRAHPKKGSIWTVRCSCGRTETRTTRGIVNRVDPAPDCCQTCQSERGRARIAKLNADIQKDARAVIEAAIAESLNGSDANWPERCAEAVLAALDEHGLHVHRTGSYGQSRAHYACTHQNA
jgi:hypothetical protein